MQASRRLGVRVTSLIPTNTADEDLLCGQLLPRPDDTLAKSITTHRDERRRPERAEDAGIPVRRVFLASYLTLIRANLRQ